MSEYQNEGEYEQPYFGEGEGEPLYMAEREGNPQYYVEGEGDQQFYIEGEGDPQEYDQNYQEDPDGPQPLKNEEVDEVESKIKNTNNELDKLNNDVNEENYENNYQENNEENYQEYNEEPNYDRQQNDSALYGEMTMPEEFQEKLEPPEDFSEINDSRATPLEEAAVELNKTEEIDLESIPARVEADDADSGDNTDDLDPRAEFEKKKEKMEMINSQIDQYSNELTKLRRQLTVLEDEEFKFYTVKGNDNDQTAQKLKYQLTQCHNIVAKENLSDIMKKLEELDNKVKEKLTRDEYINSKVDHIYQKIGQLKSILIPQMISQIEHAIKSAHNRNSELGLILEMEYYSKLNRIQTKKMKRVIKGEKQRRKEMLKKHQAEIDRVKAESIAKAEAEAEEQRIRAQEIEQMTRQQVENMQDEEEAPPEYQAEGDAEYANFEKPDEEFPPNEDPQAYDQNNYEDQNNYAEEEQNYQQNDNQEVLNLDEEGTLEINEGEGAIEEPAYDENAEMPEDDRNLNPDEYQNEAEDQPNADEPEFQGETINVEKEEPLDMEGGSEQNEEGEEPNEDQNEMNEQMAAMMMEAAMQRELNDNAGLIMNDENPADLQFEGQDQEIIQADDAPVDEEALGDENQEFENPENLGYEENQQFDENQQYGEDQEAYEINPGLNNDEHQNEENGYGQIDGERIDLEAEDEDVRFIDQEGNAAGPDQDEEIISVHKDRQSDESSQEDSIDIDQEDQIRGEAEALQYEAMENQETITQLQFILEKLKLIAVPLAEQEPQQVYKNDEGEGDNTYYEAEVENHNQDEAEGEGNNEAEGEREIDKPKSKSKSKNSQKQKHFDGPYPYELLREIEVEYLNLVNPQLINELNEPVEAEDQQPDKNSERKASIAKSDQDEAEGEINGEGDREGEGEKDDEGEGEKEEHQNQGEGEGDSDEQKLQKQLDEQTSLLKQLKSQVKATKQDKRVTSFVEFQLQLQELQSTYDLRVNELKSKMKLIATKIPMIVKEAKDNKANFEELNGIKKDKMAKIDALRNKREASMLKAIQLKKKLEIRYEEFKSHEQTLNDKMIQNENIVLKLKKKNGKISGGNSLFAALSKSVKTDYKKQAKMQNQELEQKVESLEKELFQLNEEQKQKAKVDSDEDLDIIDDEPSQINKGKKGALPDIRITTKTKGKNSQATLQGYIKTIKEKDDQIVMLKDEVRRIQASIKKIGKAKAI